MELRRDQWLTLIILAATNIFASSTNSLQAPFYPAEAMRKGASATEYGFVFGAFELTSFLVSPLAGKIVEKYEVRFLSSGGMAISSMALILFGLTDHIQSRILFIGASIILRIIEAAGTILATITGFALIGALFPDSLATTFATLEIFYGSGFILGPSIGGLLFTIGGFSFPFIFVGVIGIMISISIIILFRYIPVKLPQEKESHKARTALKVPEITLNLVFISIITISTGFYSALLEPHLQQFDLSPLVTSLFFVISGATYALSSPFFGKLIDKGLEPWKLLITSCVLIIGSCTIIGPAPFMPFDATIPSCIVALVLQGLASGTSIVSTFAGAFRAARNAGYPDSIGTFGLISGLWMGAFSLGAFLGPSIGGILYDLVGFRWATMFLVVNFVILLFVVIVFTIFSERKDAKYDSVTFDNAENTPLLTG